MDRESAIIACASAPGRGGRALLRLSGPAAFDILRACGPLEASPQRGGRLWRMFGEVPCLLMIMPGPTSFTGDDCAEILLAGNPDLTARVEAKMLAVHDVARRAAPGEFTWRAFVNGRIDLSQAEGIAATIAATTDAQLRAARQLADGGISRFVRELSERVADDLALVEAGIDFTDQDDVVAIAPDALAHDVSEIIEAIRPRIEHSVPVERIDAVPRVVLAGPPNAGKSTLFNALLERTRTVVSSVPGTTRDAISEPATMPTATGPIDVRLIDVAGLDDDASGHNRAMHAAARGAMDSADLVVWCVPPGEVAPAPAPRTLQVFMKSDLVRHNGLCVSGLTGAGLDPLRSAIGARLRERLAGDEAVFLSHRHETLLGEAADHLRRTLAVTAPELVAANLRLALDALGGISGAMAPDEVLGRIFGKFCIGK